MSRAFLVPVFCLLLACASRPPPETARRETRKVTVKKRTVKRAPAQATAGRPSEEAASRASTGPRDLPDPADVSPGAPVSLDAPEVQRAQRAVAELKQQLMGALMAALQQGPANAVSVCRDEAPAIAQRVSGPDLRIGRASDRPRNPDNAPEGWVAPLLHELSDLPEDETGPMAVRLPDGGVGYVEPIRVGGPCLSCHGTDLEPELAARIRSLYPEDRATGYHVGDFRGVFWVEVR